MPKRSLRVRTFCLIPYSEYMIIGSYSAGNWSTVFNLNNVLHFVDTPSGEQAHSLLGLANFDFAHLPDAEVMGEDLMRQYQKILLEHYSSDKIAVLPGDVVQKLMLGVCISIISIISPDRHSHLSFN